MVVSDRLADSTTQYSKMQFTAHCSGVRCTAVSTPFGDGCARAMRDVDFSRVNRYEESPPCSRSADGSCTRCQGMYWSLPRNCQHWVLTMLWTSLCWSYNQHSRGLRCRTESRLCRRRCHRLERTWQNKTQFHQIYRNGDTPVGCCWDVVVKDACIDMRTAAGTKEGLSGLATWWR